MYKSEQSQLGSDLLARFLQSRFWDGWNGSSSDAPWDESQEIMALINETILNGISVGEPAAALVPGQDGPFFYDPNSGLLPGNATVPLPFFGDYFVAFHKAYFSVHGYLAIVISIFGIVSNVINIAVLSQKSMLTPTNAILTALALVDALVMLTYVPFALHQYIWKSSQSIRISEWRTYSWMVFICFNINFTIVCHTISVWLTITLAVFRYIAVSFPAKVQEYCSMKRAIMGIVMAFLCTGIICTPSYLSVQVEPVNDPEYREQMEPSEQNMSIYRIDESDLSKNNSNIPRIISFYAFSVLAKLVPCVVLTYLSIQLVRALIQAERRRFQLKNPNGLPPRRPTASSSATISSYGPRFSLATETTQFLAPPVVKHVVVPQQQTRPAGRDRTTRMLLAILVFFLITEFPSGMVALFSCFSTDFFTYVYVPLGDFMDILALINSSVNFILYCSMSRQFRKTFCHMFVPKVVTERWKRWKIQRGGLLSSSAPIIPLSERTITYFPGTRTDNHDRRVSSGTILEDDLGVS